MPGCVRARIAVGNGTETFEEDPRGNVTLCTGAVPVFEGQITGQEISLGFHRQEG